jgi:hypothetical protein
MNYLLTRRLIYLLNETVSIYLPYHIDTFNGIRIYYPELYEIIQDEEEEQKNRMLDYIEWIID